MFYFAFFSIFSFSFKGQRRNLTAPYPINRGVCWANIEGHLYNLADIEGDAPYQYHYLTDGYNYYIRFCKELTLSELGLPSTSDFDPSDVYVARCKDSSCEALITENTWDWRYLDSSNSSKGVIYSGIGEPFIISTDVYFTFDINLKLTCNPKVEPTPTYKIIFDAIDTTETELTLIAENKLGCPKPTITPTPSPSPFNPQCNFTDRYDDKLDFGIDLHLEEMNSGAYGVRAMVSADNSFVLFFQPCERMSCPPDYTCTDNLSSVWLCAQKEKTCDSYGTVGSKYESFIEPLADDLFDNLKLTYNHSVGGGGHTNVILQCKMNVPANHFLFATNFERNNNDLTFYAHNSNSCPKPIPDPTPRPSRECYFNKTNYEMGSTITLNLTAHDKADMKGWSSTVQYGITKTGTLYYEPCDNVACPPDAFCEGDEDATVYLCHEGDDGKPDCIGYGLLENNVTTRFTDTYDITDGVDVIYEGDFKRSATVNWKCDQTLATNEIRMPSEVKLNSHALSFTVYSKAACASGNPTPRPPYHPPRPKRPTSPTPTPQPSVNPTDIQMINDTHYIITSLTQYQQDIYKGNLTLCGPSLQESSLYVEFHPWTLIPCPTGYVCSAGHTESNFWACWVEDDNTPYCHSIGDVRILNDMKLRTPSNPDLGVELHFGGVWGLDSYLDLECDLQESNYSIPFDHGTVASYRPGSLKIGNHFMIYLDSGAACPRQFESPPIPTKAPTPTPKPDYTPQFTFTSDPNKDGKVIHIELEKLPHYYDEIITVGEHLHYQRNLYRYYPVTPGLPPSGYEILDNENSNDNALANIWRCFNASNGKRYCHSAGNVKTGLYYDVITDELDGGVSLNYDGGYGGWETHIQIICNRSVPETKIDFDDVGLLVANFNVPIIFAHTSMACLVDSPKPTPAPVIFDRNSITGGAIFLFILTVVALIYVAVGFLFGFVRYGSIDMPNKEFWREFALDLETAVVFIFTCGKRASTNIAYKQEI